MRRLLDFSFALAGIVLLSPLLAAIALLIAWREGRPVLFRQTRVGRRGRPFEIRKFRTMRAASDGGPITAAGDRRVFRVGARLRRYKLDELPQLFNVLKGEMSLIGPRPEVPAFVKLDSAIWQRVLESRPGITDLASLVYRNEEELLGTVGDPEAYYRTTILPAKLALNLHYMKTRSFRLDLKLLWLTLRYSLVPAGFDAQRIVKPFRMGACKP